MKHDRKGFDFGYFEITNREILTSISIITVMILIGILISGKISEYQMDLYEEYNKAVKIESQELFQYGMDTNIGNAFVYGDLEAVDTVTYPEINGEYMYIKKVKEEYTKHAREVAHSNGKTTWYTTEEYWTWDEVGSENIKCKEISFCGVKFPSNKISLPGSDYIDTVKESHYIRYKYYGVGTKYTGTIFTDLRDGTISDYNTFYNNFTIDETLNYFESGILFWIFWMLWIVFIGFTVFGFYYLDNKWLE